MGDLILSAAPGYYVADTDLWPWYLRPLSVFGPDLLASPLLGAGISSGHGYRPDTPGVAGVLYAWGAGIARGRALDALQMIDLHPTIAYLLGIRPGQPVDGSPVRDLLDTSAGLAARRAGEP